MDRNYARALPLVLKWEGGWSDHPSDPGGATNKGVTLATFRRYVKADGTKDDLRKITDAQVSTVYYRHYWSVANCQAMPAGLDYAIFDFAVNSGPSRAVKFLQRIVGVTVDGRVGPKTIDAIDGFNTDDLVRLLCDERLEWLQTLRTWKTFGKGWTNRVVDVKRNALKMVGDPADVKEIPVPIPKPVVPEEVETEVKKKRNRFVKWISSILGSGGGGAWLMGIDWKAIAVGGGIGVACLVLLIFFAEDITKGIKTIKKAVEE